jgi:hypothetical protein
MKRTTTTGNTSPPLISYNPPIGIGPGKKEPWSGGIRKVTFLYLSCMLKREGYKLYTRRIQEAYKKCTTKGGH